MLEKRTFFQNFLNWTKNGSPEIDADQYSEAFAQLKANLLEQYQIRLKAKIANRLPINLTAKPTDFGTSPERVEIYFKDLTIESADIADEIGKIIDSHQRLLLIGDPGAGKTTILLFAAVNILNDARKQKLPLLLNLATWQSELGFAHWYAQSIAQTYGLSPVFVRGLLQHNAIVPFFDGLDEMNERYRDDCFHKMAAYFGDSRNKQFIISSRKKEYAATKADAPVYAELEVEPLSLVQIKKALSENAHRQAADRALLQALDQDKWLGKAVETPFYLNTASFLFGKGERTFNDFAFKAKSKDGRQTEIVETFLAEQVPNKINKEYLHFIAKKMNNENFLVFELLKIQIHWSKNIWRYRIVFGLLMGTVIGMSVGRACDAQFGCEVGAFVGIATSLLLSSPIQTFEVQFWHWKNFKKRWMLVPIFTLFTILLIILLLFTLVSILGIKHYDQVDIIQILILVSCLGLGIGILEAGVETNHLLHISTPYKRYLSTFKSRFVEIYIVIASLLLAVMIYYFIYRKVLIFDVIKLFLLYRNLIFLTAFFLLVVGFANSQIPQHFSLRLILYIEKNLPLRLVTFLDRMTDQHIFEDNRRTINGKKTRGASWRFRHKILQDYFANLEVK